jgi:beta-glucosidase-like glycosyl hydrolase
MIDAIRKGVAGMNRRFFDESVDRAVSVQSQKRMRKQRKKTADDATYHMFAQKAAEASIVLLKNEGRVFTA